MPEDIIERMLPALMSAKEQGLESSRAQQEYQYQQQQRVKQAPIEDLARQVKMMQLKNELKSAPSIAKLLSGANSSTAPQEPVGPQGQQPTVSPQAMFERTTQVASNVWSQATDPNNPRNLLDNPQALADLKDSLKTKIDFAKTGLLGQQGVMAFKNDPSVSGGIRPVKEGEQPDGYTQPKGAGTVHLVPQGGSKLSPDLKRFEELHPEATQLRQEGDMEEYNKQLDAFKSKEAATKAEQGAKAAGMKFSAINKEQEKVYSMSDQALETMAQQEILTGKKPTFSYGIAGSVQRKQYNENFAGLSKRLGYADVTDATLKQFENKADQSALNQTTKMEALSKTYEETAKNFLDRLPELRDKIDLSKYKKWADFQSEYEAGWEGDPDVINLKTQLYDALVESGKVITGQFGIGGMPEGARTRMDEILRASDQPETFQKVINTLELNMSQRNQNLENTKKKILTSMGKSPKETGMKIITTPDGKRWKKTDKGMELVQ